MIFWQILLLTMLVFSHQQCNKPYLRLQTIPDAFTSAVLSVSISYDGQYMVGRQGFFFRGRKVGLFKNNGKIFDLLGQPQFPVDFNDSGIYSQWNADNTFLGNSSKLLLASNIFIIYDIANISDLKSVAPLQIIQLPGKDLIFNAISKDGNKIFATAKDRNAPQQELYIFQRNGSQTPTFKKLPSLLTYYMGVKISPNGKYLVSYYRDKVQIHIEDQKNPGNYLDPTELNIDKIDAHQYQDVDLTNDVLAIVGLNTLRIFKRKPNTDQFIQIQKLNSLIGFGAKVVITHDQSKIVIQEHQGSLLILGRNQSSLQYYNQQTISRFGNPSYSMAANDQYIILGTASPNTIQIYIKCQLCVSKQGLFKDNNQCVVCDANCKTCINQPTNCLSCNGQYLKNGSCDTCNDTNEFINGQDCVACDANCKTCIGNASTCLNCHQYCNKDILSIPAIIGIVIASLVFAGIIIKLILCYCIKNEQQPKNQQIQQFQMMENCQCKICLQDIKAPALYQTNKVCIHRYHKFCITEWVKRNHNCPQCFVELKLSNFNPDQYYDQQSLQVLKLEN